MIELPANPAPNNAQPGMLDFGFVLRPSSGAAAQRINRGGSRYTLAVSFPPMRPETARVFVARLQQAKREGLRMPYPLLGASQGAPGAPLIDGTDSIGTTLKLKSLTAGYAVREGYWLTVIDAAGALYLHQVATTVFAAADGKAVLALTIPLRCALANNAAVLLAKPMIEGIVTSEVNWVLPVNRIVSGIGFAIEEAA